MKATKWAIALLLGFGAILSACTKDTVNDPDTDPKPEPTETAYFSFGFSSTMKTRALDSKEEAGTIEEQQVALVWMLLYNTDGQLKYAYELDATNINKTDPTQLTEFYGGDVSTEVASSTDGFITVGKEVAVQDYQLVILVNPLYYTNTYGNYLTGFTESKGVKGSGINPMNTFYNLSTLMDVNQGEGDRDYGDPNGGVFIADTDALGFTGGFEYTEGVKAPFEKLFFMSNANGVISVPGTSLQKTQEEAEQNPSGRVNTDRLFAKIMVNERTGSHTPIVTGGALQGLTYGLKKRNQNIYPIRLFANTYNKSGANNYEGAMETAETGRELQYATDPNFDVQDTKFADSKVNQYVNEFISWNAWDGTSTDIEENNWMYAPENTMPLAVQSAIDWADYTTQVHIKAIIYYNFPSPDNNKSYYSWYDSTEGEWVLFSHAMAKEWMASTSGIDDLDALIGYTKEGTFTKGTSSFFTGATSSTITNFAPPVAISNSTPSLKTDTNGDLTYHHMGYNEYFIPIKHFPGGESMTAEQKRTGVYGHYGIVRNNVYRVVINSIEGPGTPLGDGWISADIHVNGWYKRPDQVEDL